MTYIDKRFFEVELKNIRIEKETQYSYQGDYVQEKLFCKKCDKNLTKVIEENNGDYEVNFCPSCGTDLRK